MYWTTGSGRIELNITKKEADSAFHQGQCDDDVKALSITPKIRRQLKTIDPCILRDELSEYGAWDESELQDHETNLQRILWIACGDINEGGN